MFLNILNVIFFLISIIVVFKKTTILLYWEKTINKTHTFMYVRVKNDKLVFSQIPEKLLSPADASFSRRK